MIDPQTLEDAIKASQSLTRKLIEARTFWQTSTGERKLIDARVPLEHIASVIGVPVLDREDA